MMLGSVLAVAVAVLGLALTVAWIASRRRQEETRIGIQALANMKWRDCVMVVLEALHRDGYQPMADAEPLGGGETEFLLDHAGQKVLLGYKHGTAYRFGTAAVRDFANNLQMRGAGAGVLVTLGTAEPDARTAAALANIQLIDGVSLWAKLRPFLPPALLKSVRDEASVGTRKGLWTGTGASALAALAVLVAGAQLNASPRQSGDALKPSRTLVAQAQSPSQLPRADDAIVRQLNRTAEAMAEVAKLTPEQLARRRADTAREVSQVSQVDNAAWSAQRTLLIALNRTDGKDKALIAEACRIILQHEEMRYTRIQLNPPPDTGLAVRWRLCE